MRWIPEGRYRRDERVSWRIQPGRGWNIPDVHHGTNNSRGSKRGPTSFQKYVREPCTAVFSAVKYGRRKPPCCPTYYPILFMSEYSKTLRCPHIPCHSVELPLPSSNRPLEHSPVIREILEKRETVSEPYAFIGSSRGCQTVTKWSKRSSLYFFIERIFSKKYKYIKDSATKTISD